MMFVIFLSGVTAVPPAVPSGVVELPRDIGMRILAGIVPFVLYVSELIGEVEPPETMMAGLVSSSDRRVFRPPVSVFS